MTNTPKAPEGGPWILINFQHLGGDASDSTSVSYYGIYTTVELAMQRVIQIETLESKEMIDNASGDEDIRIHTEEVIELAAAQWEPENKDGTRFSYTGPWSDGYGECGDTYFLTRADVEGPLY
jgi:hypothetical protein